LVQTLQSSTNLSKWINPILFDIFWFTNYNFYFFKRDITFLYTDCCCTTDDEGVSTPFSTILMVTTWLSLAFKDDWMDHVSVSSMKKDENQLLLLVFRRMAIEWWPVYCVCMTLWDCGIIIWTKNMEFGMWYLRKNSIFELNFNFVCTPNYDSYRGGV